MSDNLVSAALIIGGVALAFKTISSFLLSNLYDLKQINLKYDQKLHPHKRVYRSRPLISLIISTNNDSVSIESCLNSIKKCSYKKLEVIVLDSNSSDDTKKIIKNFAAQTKAMPIRLVARRTSNASPKDLKRDIKKYAHGELILNVAATASLDKNCLKNLVNQFNLDQSLEAMTLREVPVNDYTLSSLLQKYQSFTDNRLHKFNSRLGINVSKTWTIYKTDVFLDNISGKRSTSSLNMAYASNAVVLVNKQSNLLKVITAQAKINFLTIKAEFMSYKLWPLALSSLISTLFVPIISSYIIFLAVSLKEPTLLLLSLILITLTGILSIWQDSKLLLSRKVLYSLTIPVTFVFYYLASIAALFRALKPLLWPDLLRPSTLR